MPHSLANELETVRQLRTTAQKSRLYRSRLDRYQAEIEQLVELGASHRDIVCWLRQHKRIKTHPTTVGRRLRAWAQKR